MTAKVTSQGLVIPKEMLGDAEEVEIRQENNVLIISPIVSKDPILELGQHPVAAGISDASINHDTYLYSA